MSERIKENYFFCCLVKVFQSETVKEKKRGGSRRKKKERKKENLCWVKSFCVIAMSTSTEYSVNTTGKKYTAIVSYEDS